jgi:hypothetical protein
MSSFSVKGTDIDVEAIMANIRKRIEEKRKGLYTDEEVREIAEMKLDSVLDASEFNSDFVTAFRERDAQWNFSFNPETIYASSRGVLGSLIRLARKALNPILKLLFNPNPIISALSRQSDLNRYYVLLLHNMALEMTKMNLEMTHLKARLRATGIRVDFQSRREKVLEEMTVSRERSTSASGGDGSARRRSKGGRRQWRRRRGTRNGGDNKRQSSSGTQSAGSRNSTSSS